MLFRRDVLKVLDGERIFVVRRDTGERLENAYRRNKLIRKLMDLGYGNDDAWLILIEWDRLTDGGAKSIYDAF